jgi:hypothetical protein
MSLLLNGIRSYGGSPITLMGQGWQNFFADHMLSSSMNSAGFGKTASMPRGYYPPSCVAIAVTAGQMSSFRRVTGEGDLVGAMLKVKLATAGITGSGTLAALGGLIVQAVAAITGSGTISSADLKAFLAAVAALSGSGTISSADLEGLGALLAAISGTGTAAGAGASTCTACLAGRFAPAGAASCSLCPAGSSSWGPNCGRGNFCPDGSSAPTPCPLLVPPVGGWGASKQVQGPAFLVETARCLNHCFWNSTSGDGALSKC